MLKWDPTTVFSLNFLAIIPLAAVLSFATEEISKRLGETLGGLLNATFGNAVELIVRYPVSPCSVFSASLTHHVGQRHRTQGWRDRSCPVVDAWVYPV